MNLLFLVLLLGIGGFLVWSVTRIRKDLALLVRLLQESSPEADPYEPHSRPLHGEEKTVMETEKEVHLRHLEEKTEIRGVGDLPDQEP